jgi:glutathione S-transferase
VLRYSQHEPDQRDNKVVGDYAKWFLGRLRAVEAATANADTLCAGRFTAADIVIGYALRLASNIGLAKDFGPNVAAYWARLQQRDGFKRAVAAEQKAGAEQNVAPRVRA